jgi:hypothetical protein
MSLNKFLLPALLALTPSVARAGAPDTKVQLEVASRSVHEQTERCLNLADARGITHPDSPQKDSLLERLRMNGEEKMEVYEPTGRSNGQIVVVVNDKHIDPSYDTRRLDALQTSGVKAIALEGWNGEDTFLLNGQSDFIEIVLNNPDLSCLGLEEDGTVKNAFLIEILVLEKNKISLRNEDTKALAEKAKGQMSEAAIKKYIESQIQKIEAAQIHLALGLFDQKNKGQVDSTIMKERFSSRVWLEFKLEEAAQQFGFGAIKDFRSLVKDRKEETTARLDVLKETWVIQKRDEVAVNRLETVYQYNPNLGPTAVWFGEGHAYDLIPRLQSTGFTVIETKSDPFDTPEMLELRGLDALIKQVDEQVKRWEAEEEAGKEQ